MKMYWSEHNLRSGSSSTIYIFLTVLKCHYFDSAFAGTGSINTQTDKLSWTLRDLTRHQFIILIFLFDFALSVPKPAFLI